MAFLAISVDEALRGFLKTIGYLLIFCIPSDKSLWVFTSHNGDTFAENSKYQFLYSSRQNDVRSVWISTDESTVSILRSRGYEAYAYGSFRGQLALLRSGYIFGTHRTFTPYSANAMVVQLWHGNMLKQMSTDKNKKYGLLRQLYRRIYHDWDYFAITSSSYPAKHALSAYSLEEDELLIEGYPRTDVLLRDESDAMLGIDEDIQELIQRMDDEGPLLCLMPTWNGGRTRETRFSEEKVDLQTLEPLLESFNARLLIKQHPYTQTPIDTSDFDQITVISTTVDMYPFLNRIDALITDYSSIFFDYSLVDKPMIFYAYDLEQYVNNRGLYFEYEEFVPGPVASNPTELTNAIEDVLRGEDEYAEERRYICEEFFEYQNGKACERIHNRMIAES